jgi:hypothetical protein
LHQWVLNAKSNENRFKQCCSVPILTNRPCTCRRIAKVAGFNTSTILGNVTNI